MGDGGRVHYDELADNTDDEERLFRAESWAGRKLKANKAKAKKQVTNRRGGVFPLATRVFLVSQAKGDSSATSQLSFYGMQQPAKGSAFGPCFQCGKIGHFRRSCPLLVTKT